MNKATTMLLLLLLTASCTKSDIVISIGSGATGKSTDMESEIDSRIKTGIQAIVTGVDKSETNTTGQKDGGSLFGEVPVTGGK